MHVTFKKLTSKHVFIILLVSVILLLIIIYTNHTYINTSQPIAKNQYLSPTQTPTVIVSISPQVSTTSSLSSSDIAVKNSLLNRLLHGVAQSGIVYQTSTVQIQYIATDNIFQAEI